MKHATLRLICALLAALMLTAALAACADAEKPDDTTTEPVTTTQRDEEGKILHTQVWNVSDEERHLMLSEIGDILWQTAGLAKVMGVTLEDFSSGAVCLVLAEDLFEEADYIRDYDEYLQVYAR